MDETDRIIVNALQGGFPVVDEPFREVAQELSLDEADLRQRLQGLCDSGVLTRFGPMFQVERMGGAFVLAAMAVPADRFDEVAAQISALPMVAHSYQREHCLNLWFVLAAESRQAIEVEIESIERATGLALLDFPKECEYFVGLRLEA